jgi:cytochrome c5
MPDPDQQYSNRFKLALGLLIGMAVGQVALADSEELAATQAAPNSTIKAAAVPVTSAAALTGPQVYNNVCIACHSPPGVGGAATGMPGLRASPRV